LDKIPDREEVKRVINAARLEGKVAISFMAFSGLRPDDVVRLTYDCIKEDYEAKRIPMKILVPQGKTGNYYVTFMGQQGVKHLDEWFNLRKSWEQSIEDKSPIMCSGKRNIAAKPIISLSLSQLIKRAIRTAGFKLLDGRSRFRAYSFRKYFRTTLAISRVNPDFSEALIGHIDGLSSIYNGIRDKSPQMIEELRKEYAKIEGKLSTEIDNEKLTKQLKEQQEQIEHLQEIAEKLIGEPEMDFIRNAGLTGKKTKEPQKTERKTSNSQIQRVIQENKLEDWLTDGWNFKAALNNGSGKVIVEKASQRP